MRHRQQKTEPANVLGTKLTQLSGYTLPKGYTFTISLATSNPGNDIVSVTFSGKNQDGVAFGSLTLQLTSQTDLQTTQDIQPAVLSPAYVIGVYLVGTDNSEAATLSSGAGTITLNSTGMTVYPSWANIPAAFNITGWGTTENSNAIYTEVPTGSATNFTQAFTVP
jgi:hypothetical protein